MSRSSTRSRPGHKKSPNPHGTSNLSPCKNAKLGCTMKLLPGEEEEHLSSRCNFTFISCDSCGQRVLRRDLYTHQTYRKCYENKLRQEVVRSGRRNNTQVREHHQALRAELAHREMQKRRTFRIRLHEKIGYTPRVPSAWGSIYACDLPLLEDTASLSLDTRSGGDHANTRCSSSTFLTELDMAMEPQYEPGSYSAGEVGAPDEGEAVEFGIGQSGAATPSASRAQRIGSVQSRTSTGMTQIPLACSLCHKMFFEKSNHNKACCWHKGPIIQIFGGTCQDCGRLDHLKGCMESAHEV